MKKEARVHMLATEDPSCIAFHKLKDEEPGLFYSDKPSVEEAFDNQHLYITTDDEIKEGDWYLWKGAEQKNIHQCKISVENDLNKLNVEYKYLAEKIIATTDTKLTKTKSSKDKKGFTEYEMRRLFEIPQSFIEEYCKAGGIDKILVEYKVITNTYDNMVDLMCPHSVAEYEQTTSSTLELKTDTNNCIIIHPVEEKMYSRDTFDKMLKECYQSGVDGVSWEEVAKRIKRKLIEIVEPKSE